MFVLFSFFFHRQRSHLFFTLVPLPLETVHSVMLVHSFSFVTTVFFYPAHGALNFFTFSFVPFFSIFPFATAISLASWPDTARHGRVNPPWQRVFRSETFSEVYIFFYYYSKTTTPTETGVVRAHVTLSRRFWTWSTCVHITWEKTNTRSDPYELCGHSHDRCR